MKKILIALLFVPFAVRADTVVNGALSFDTTWSPDNGVYVLQGAVTVPAGVTLTIEPGTVIKGQNGGSGLLSVYGTLNARGSLDLPISFTSRLDDSLGGDTNGDATSSLPVAGDWQGIIFRSGSSGSLSYVNIFYAGHGGFGFGDYADIENLGGNLSISYSNLANGTTYGIYNKQGVLTVDHSSVASHMIGIMIESGTSTVSTTSITNNSQYGLEDTGADPLTLTSNTFSSNGRTALVHPAIAFTHTSNTSSDISNRGFQIAAGNASDGQVLNSFDLPLIIAGGFVTIPSGETLTIDPGTIIKFGAASGVWVDGLLNAVGTQGQKIELTSLKDDTIAGDTNGDGAATSAEPNTTSDNWYGIVFNPLSQGALTHTNLHYGGTLGIEPADGALIYNLGTNVALDHVFAEKSFYEGVYQSAGTTTVANSEFTGHQIGAKILGGTFYISNSSLHGNNQYAVQNLGAITIDAKNNWWGSADGPNDTSTSSPTGSGDKVSSNILYAPWLTSLSNDATSSPATSTPSILYGTSTPVIVVPGILGSAEKNGVWVMDPILHTYDNLLDTLRANGYIDGITLFDLPYDWRKSNVVTASLLKQKIDEVKGICSCSKVNVVAHSMGGLAAQYYMESVNYGGDINQMIFIGTPHKGAAMAYLRWEAGAFASGIINELTKIYFTHQAKENGFSNLYSYIKNFPITSVEELLPITDYLHDTGSVYRTYPIGYPQNTFLENLDVHKTAMLSLGAGIKNYIGDTGQQTITGIRVVNSPSLPLWSDGYPDGFDNFFSSDHGLDLGSGDGTVPLSSAALLGTGDTVVGAGHTQLPTVVEAQVASDLLGTTTSTTVNRSLPSRVLIAQVFSPANIMMTAPNGRRVGFDPSSGAVVNEIPDAFYSGSSAQEEFVAIPDPSNGDYKVEAVGTGDGSYTVAISTVSSGSVQSTSYTSVTAPGQRETKNVVVGDSALSVPAPSSNLATTPKVAALVGSRHSSLQKTVMDQGVLVLKPVSVSPPKKLFIPHIAPTSTPITRAPSVAPNAANVYQGARALSGFWHKFTGWLRSVLVRH